jgi:hypothetical protein
MLPLDLSKCIQNSSGVLLANLHGVSGVGRSSDSLLREFCRRSIENASNNRREVRGMVVEGLLDTEQRLRIKRFVWHRCVVTPNEAQNQRRRARWMVPRSKSGDGKD